MSNINKLDGISAVEDLTDAAAAVVEGGADVSGSLNFDSFDFTKLFTVSSGKAVMFSATTREGGSGFGSSYTAVLRNSATRRTTSPKTVRPGSTGSGSVVWSNMRGGSYQVVLSDTRDGVIITGDYRISFP